MIGDDVDEKTVQANWTPLMLAVKGGHFLVIRFLLEMGADREAANISGGKAIDYAEMAINQAKQGKRDQTDSSAIHFEKIKSLLLVC